MALKKTNWLKTRRKQIGINQEVLAARLQLAGFDVARASISHWESNRYRPPLEDKNFRRALAEALEMSIGSMLIEAGYEISDSYSREAMKAADLVEHLPEEKRGWIVGVIEQLVRGAGV